jgi:2,3,4,5-tetrahydropyridine-2-carboxylate N-succinyltransferase
MSATLFSLAFGVGTQNRQGTWLEVFYPQPLVNPAAELIDAIGPILGYTGGNQAITFSNSQAGQLAERVKAIDAATSRW